MRNAVKIEGNWRATVSPEADPPRALAARQAASRTRDAGAPIARHCVEPGPQAPLRKVSPYSGQRPFPSACLGGAEGGAPEWVVRLAGRWSVEGAHRGPGKDGRGPRRGVLFGNGNLGEGRHDVGATHCRERSMSDSREIAAERRAAKKDCDRKPRNAFAGSFPRPTRRVWNAAEQDHLGVGNFDRLRFGLTLYVNDEPGSHGGDPRGVRSATKVDCSRSQRQSCTIAIRPVPIRSCPVLGRRSMMLAASRTPAPANRRRTRKTSLFSCGNSGAGSCDKSSWYIHPQVVSGRPSTASSSRRRASAQTKLLRVRDRMSTVRPPQLDSRGGARRSLQAAKRS